MFDGTNRWRIGGDGTARVAGAYEPERRASRGDRLGTGTLACTRCDAPIALGERSVAPTETLSCPFCDRRAPAREFLSLSAPSRPARVAVRVRLA